MDIRFRDNTLAQNRLILRLTFIWALSSSLIAIILVFLCVYINSSRETHWLPMCLSGQYQISQRHASPNYIKDVIEHAIDLRLTYNKDTVESRFDAFLMLVAPNQVESLKALLKEEQKTIIAKDIASVFYIERITLDVSKHKAVAHGKLVETSHAVTLPDAHKVYELSYQYHAGLISILSMKEVHDEKE